MNAQHLEEEDPLSIRPRLSAPPWRMSWGAVFAGTVLSLGIWLLLYVLGLGVGLTAIDPDDPRSLHGAGMTTGIWSIVVPLVALFIGGIAAAKVGGAMTRTAAAIQGGVVWALSVLAVVFAFASITAALVGGAVKMGHEASTAVGALAGHAAQAGLAKPGIDDVVAMVNQRLQAEGKPPVTADQLGAASRQALELAIREGRFDRNTLVNAISSTTALSPTDAGQIADALQQRFSDIGASAQADALQAAEDTGKGLIGLFIAMLLGLIAAIVGTMVGITRGQRVVADRVAKRAERLADRYA
jgi:ABC-type transport system involved in multi-copper enzyme maturation permease subunit